MPLRIPAVLSFVAALAACRQAAPGPAPFTAMLAATDLWSGGELNVVSTAFVGSGGLPTVWLDNDRLAVRRVDDSTVAARLPLITISGSKAVRVVQGSDSAELGSVRIHGFADEVSGPFMSGYAYWTPMGGPPTVIAGGDSGAVVVDLRTNAIVQTVPDSVYSSDCTFSVGPTYAPDRFVFEGKRATGGCTGPRVWRLTQTLQLIDTLAASSGPWYVIAQPGPQRWYYNWNNNSHLVNCATGTCVDKYFPEAGGPDAVIISPRGDRFLWNNQWPGTAVHDATSLDTAFLLPTYWNTRGAAFSFDGDTLFLATSDTSGLQLVALRASSGTVLRNVTDRDLPVDSVTSITRGGSASIRCARGCMRW